MYNIYESFKQYAVPAANVEDFLQQYSKHRAHAARDAEYVACRIVSYAREIEKYGFCFITHHDSTTGEIVAYYPQ